METVKKDMFSGSTETLKTYKDLIAEATSVKDLNDIAKLALTDKEVSFADELAIQIAISNKIKEDDFDGCIFEFDEGYFALAEVA